MKINKKELTLENGLKKEWILTNGIGGYCASTVLGINTRKYHGLLIAPLTPPAKRNLILSKLDETIEIENEEHILYSNVCKNYISNGYKVQEQFEKEYIPIFTYKVGNVTIKKLICMEYGKNTTCILYNIENNGEQAKLRLYPVVNFRDFHTMTTDHEFNLKQTKNRRKLKIEVDEKNDTPIFMYCSEGEYIQHDRDTFWNMHYIEEEKRGFYPEENLAVTGRYEIVIPKNSRKEISFICSLEANIEEIDVRKVINREIIRINELMFKSGLIDLKQDMEKESKEQKEEREVLRNFIQAADSFIVYRPNFSLHTIIAGYPWFLDWGRDSLISFEGLLLLTKRYNIAREILLTTVRDIKFGLVPNGYSGYDNRPLYNSADSSLLLFEQVYKYITYTNDYKFIEKNIYDKLVIIIENYKKGIDLDNNDIYLEKDGLISSGNSTTQNTWMDAKYGNYAFTPRNGKAVEINALWYNSLKIIEELSIKFGKKEKSKEYKKLAEKTKEVFLKKFYNKRKKCLDDVVGDSRTRPNQLFALSLSHPVVEPNSEEAKQIVQTVEKKLLNKYGLKTLAKNEKGYVDTYEGDAFRRDSSYHQGITWPWLLGLYYDSIKNMIKYEKDKKTKKELENKLNEFKQKTKKTFKKAFYEEGTIGTISELYDSKQPQLPKGTMSQAWSVAEIFRIIYTKDIL